MAVATVVGTGGWMMDGDPRMSNRSFEDQLTVKVWVGKKQCTSPGV